MWLKLSALHARKSETKVKKMAIRMYFKRSLPTSKDTGIDQETIRRANEKVQRVLDGGQKSVKKPRKERTMYSDED